MRKLMGLKVGLLVVCLLMAAAMPATGSMIVDRFVDDPMMSSAVFFGGVVDDQLLDGDAPIQLDSGVYLVVGNAAYTRASHSEPTTANVPHSNVSILTPLRAGAIFVAPFRTSAVHAVLAVIRPKPTIEDVAEAAFFTVPAATDSTGVPITARAFLIKLVAGLGMVGALAGAVVTNKLRLQFDFSPDAVKDLDELKDEMGLTSRVDVVKHALGLLQWVMQVRQRGAELLVEEKGEQRVVVLPLLSRASDRRG